MSQMTITEAFAELKTIPKRIAKKQQFIESHIARLDITKDPLAKDGGADIVIAKEIQSIGDLWERAVKIRGAIASANATASVTVSGTSRTVGDWIVWRREIAPQRQTFLGKMRQNVENARAQAKQRGVSLSERETGNANDIIVNINERKLLADIESVETILGELDGRLSLHNATTAITVAD